MGLKIENNPSLGEQNNYIANIVNAYIVYDLDT